jgi:hypothetical protein
MTTTYQQQRSAAKIQATLNPDKCGLCRGVVTMTNVLKCRQCGGQCCPNCNARPSTARVICKACE